MCLITNWRCILRGGLGVLSNWTENNMTKLIRKYGCTTLSIIDHSKFDKWLVTFEHLCWMKLEGAVGLSVGLSEKFVVSSKTV